MVHVEFPNFTIFGVFCSSLYAVSGFDVLFVQLSKRPVILWPVLIDPPSKHCVQLFTENAELELQATEAYSQAEEPAAGVTVVAAERVVFAAKSTGVSVSAAKTPATGERATSATTLMVRDRIG